MVANRIPATMNLPVVVIFLLMLCMSHANECEDNEYFLFRNKAGKDCAWISKRKKNWRKWLCSKQTTLKSCPVSCGRCITKCPWKFDSPKFKKSCENYQDGLDCYYNPIFMGCTWDGLRCEWHKKYSCIDSEWRLVTMMPLPCASPPKGLPRLKKCKPCTKVLPSAKCPSEKPESQSECNEVGLKCNYDFEYSGCNKKELKCTPMSFYTCGDDKTWNLALADKRKCPPASQETKCPPWKKSPIFKKSCGNYPDGIECRYDHIFMGCTWDTLQCTSSNKYSCFDSKWQQATMMPLPCANPPKDLPRLQKCKPCPKVLPADKCPSKKPKIQSKCGEVGLQCKYDFNYSGCSKEKLKCTPMSLFTCGDDKTWKLAVVAKEKCPKQEPAIFTLSPSESPSYVAT